MELTLATKIGILSSGLFLWVGMLTGAWKYLSMRQSPTAQAHYYVDVAHRASLLYAPACLILAVLAQYSVWTDALNVGLVLINVVFFALSVLSYVLHGLLKDTRNQFAVPHRVGAWTLPQSLMLLFMWSLLLSELGATAILLWGTAAALL